MMSNEADQNSQTDRIILLEQKMDEILQYQRVIDDKLDALGRGVYYWLEKISADTGNEGPLAHGIYYWLNKISSNTNTKLDSLDNAARLLLVSSLIDELNMNV